MREGKKPNRSPRSSPARQGPPGPCRTATRRPHPSGQWSPWRGRAMLPPKSAVGIWRPHPLCEWDRPVTPGPSTRRRRFGSQGRREIRPRAGTPAGPGRRQGDTASAWLPVPGFELPWFSGGLGLRKEGPRPWIWDSRSPRAFPRRCSGPRAEGGRCLSGEVGSALRLPEQPHRRQPPSRPRPMTRPARVPLWAPAASPTVTARRAKCQTGRPGPTQAAACASLAASLGALQGRADPSIGEDARNRSPGRGARLSDARPREGCAFRSIGEAGSGEG
jgi:hypothetical protein